MSKATSDKAVPQPDVSMLESAHDLLLAKQMIVFGLEPGTVYADLEGRISQRRIRSLFRSITGRTAKSGVRPVGTEWWGKSDTHRLHASVFIGHASMRSRHNDSFSETFLHAYESYLRWVMTENKEEILNADRAYYLLVQFLRTKRLVLVSCSKCGTESIGNRWDTVIALNQCPVCSLIPRKRKFGGENTHFVTGNASGLVHVNKSLSSHELDQQTLPAIASS